MPSQRISLPSSPVESPRASLLSPWQPPRRSMSSGGGSPYAQSRSAAVRDNFITTAEKLQRRALVTVRKMSLLQRILAVFVLLMAATFGILFLVFNDRIFDWLGGKADNWKNKTGGWTILWALVFMTAFPPIVGYGACGTVAGFVYGVGEGWLILATATVAGSFCSFLVSRTILRKYVERMVANDKRFAALTLTLKQDGLKLLCMIRLCPLPYSLSNGAMSTFSTVHPTMYALATAIITPKLFIHTFIGSRLRAVTGHDKELSPGAKAVNWLSIAIGGMIGAFTGWYIYKKTMARARELEIEEANNARNSVHRTDEPPNQFSDDPEAQVAADSSNREDDAIDYFDDSPDEQRQYRDEVTDDEDVFGRGDGEEDEPIGLRRSKS